MNKMTVLRSLTLISIQVWVLANSIRPREQSLEMMDRIPQQKGLEGVRDEATPEGKQPDWIR